MVVRNATPVVYLSDHEAHSIPGYILLRPDEHFHHIDGYFQIRIVELIANVEAQRSEFAPLLYDCVEEGDAKEELAKECRLCYLLRELVFLIGAFEICL